MPFTHAGHSHTCTRRAADIKLAYFGATHSTTKLRPRRRGARAHTEHNQLDPYGLRTHTLGVPVVAGLEPADLRPFELIVLR